MAVTQRASARRENEPHASIAVIDGVPISVPEALGAALALLAALAALSLIALWRAGAARRREQAIADERQEAIEARFTMLAQSSAELSGRIGGMSESLGSRQTDWPVSSPRLDSVGARLGAGLEGQAQTTGESLGKLNERLAVIDAAQSRLNEMTREVVSLKDILADKQARGALAQGRMEAIVRDGLPAGRLRGSRPPSRTAPGPIASSGCPATPGCLPSTPSSRLEDFTALSAARDEEARKTAQARVRTDVGKHVKDIAERYLVPGETQDVALMFVPSEAYLFRSRRPLRRTGSEGSSGARRHRLADLDDDGDQRRPGDPARRAHARRGASNPGRGWQAHERRAVARGARGQARDAFPPGAG